MKFYDILNLHSTMFLLIHVEVADLKLKGINLHSTMFLLIPGALMAGIRFWQYLHSTMFLLIRGSHDRCQRQRGFTFHNVSINS